MKGIITLCGSHRFKDTFEQVAQDLGLAGWIVLRPAFAKDAHEYARPTDGRKGGKQKLDELHFEKIGMSQAIVVINVGDYIGESTKSEIVHAKQLGKTIYWYMYPDDYGRSNSWEDLLDKSPEDSPSDLRSGLLNR